MAKKYRVFQINEISIPAWHDAVESAVAANIAGSIKLHGVLNAPIVRMRKQKGKETPELIAGRNRLEAKSAAGKTKIRCHVIKATRSQARLMSLSENLWRKELTVLVRAEKTLEWINLAAHRMGVSGQLVQKGRIGRPPNPLTILAAGATLLEGSTPHARLKRFARYNKIANLTPEAKAKARELHLDNIQAALLEAAGVGPSPSDQIARLEAISLGNMNVYLHQPAADDSEGAPAPASKPEDVEQPTKEKKQALSSAKADPTTMMQLEGFWKKEGKKLWTYTRLEDRVRFIAMLNRATCKVKPDPRDVVSLVLRGRSKVETKRLYAYAKANGVSKAAVRRVARYQGCQHKRQGWGSAAVWFFINNDPDCKNEVRTISDAELRRLVEGRQENCEDWVGASNTYFET
ncbi:MAG TPA: ParB N-terminal domain-containing protein [Pseudolabrys sp.]|jgi:hypothetical protein|nr:ParB N-terminal domain-containing protein [Pseudolabrys sp.]